MSKMREKELNFGTSIWGLNKCIAYPNKTPNKGRSLMCAKLLLREFKG